MMRPPRILVLRGGAIGDFVATLPVLQALRREWPESYIELIGYPHIAGLAEAGRLADRVQGLDTARMARFFGLRPDIDEPTTRFLSSFDFVISFLHDPDGVVNDNLRRFGARRLFYQSPVDPNGHIVDHLVRPLESLAMYEAGAVPELDVPDELREAARARLARLGVDGRPAALHAGSGSPRKNWPLDGFRRVAESLRPAWPLAWILGEADAAIADAVRSLAGERGDAVLEGLALVEIAAVLSICGVYIGNDSGISHIAAAVGVPTLALFGPTDPAVWGPRGRRAQTLRSPTAAMADLEVGEVEAALRRMGVLP